MAFLRRIAARLSGTSEIEQLKAKGDVEGLIEVLTHKKKKVRKKSAAALVKMYNSGGLDEKHKQLILVQRDTIIKKHQDRTVSISHTDHNRPHYDTMCDLGGKPFHGDGGGHSDVKSGGHTDTGIGVNFPL